MARPLALVSLFFIAGALLLLFFVILSGAIDQNPLNQWYFLEADTSGILNAPKTSRWTLWNVCDVTADRRDTKCNVTAAFPFDPPRNFGTNDNINERFLGTSKFYYLSRFAFAFILIALFFAVVSFFTGTLALCSRLGGALSGILAAIALFFQTLTAALTTAWVILGRDGFRENNQAADIGRYMLAFVWVAMACLLIATIFFFLTCTEGRRGGKANNFSRSGKEHNTREAGHGWYSSAAGKRERGSFHAKN